MLTCTKSCILKRATVRSFVTCDPATAGGKSGSLLSQLVMRSPSMSLLFEHGNYSQLRKKRNEKDSQWQILHYKPHAWSSLLYKAKVWIALMHWTFHVLQLLLPAWFAATLVCERINLTFTHCISQKFVPWCCPAHRCLHVCRFTEMLKENFAFRLEIKTFKCLLSDVPTSAHESLLALFMSELIHSRDVWLYNDRIQHWFKQKHNGKWSCAYCDDAGFLQQARWLHWGSMNLTDVSAKVWWAVSETAERRAGGFKPVERAATHLINTIIMLVSFEELSSIATLGAAPPPLNALFGCALVFHRPWKPLCTDGGPHHICAWIRAKSH